MPASSNNHTEARKCLNEDDQDNCVPAPWLVCALIWSPVAQLHVPLLEEGTALE